MSNGLNKITENSTNNYNSNNKKETITYSVSDNNLSKKFSIDFDQN